MLTAMICVMPLDMSAGLQYGGPIETPNGCSGLRGLSVGRMMVVITLRPVHPLVPNER